MHQILLVEASPRKVVSASRVAADHLVATLAAPPRHADPPRSRRWHRSTSWRADLTGAIARFLG